MDNTRLSLIYQYLDEVLKTNEHINLTRITDPEEARMLHIEDSLSALDQVEDAPGGLYGDLGSGGGFPGVPLGIASGRDTLLIDSVQKKMKAVEEILEKLHLKETIKTTGKRIETLGNEMNGGFSVLTARALSRLGVLIELASPLLFEKGRLICLKARVDEEEIDHARALEKKVGMKMIDRSSFYLSDGETYREIIVFEKNGIPTMNLPRKVGMAQKKPL